MSINPRTSTLSLDQQASGKTGGHFPTSSLLRSASLVAQIRVSSENWFRARLELMLVQLDERLFEMAVNAPAAIEQNGFFDAMRELRQQRATFLHACMKESEDRMAAIWDPVLSGSELIGASGPGALAEPLSPELGQMCERSVEANEAALSDLLALFNGLTGSHVFDSCARPLWPSLFCLSVVSASRCLMLDASSLAVLFAVLEQYVLQDIEEWCARCAGLLLDEGVPARWRDMAHARESHESVVVSCSTWNIAALASREDAAGMLLDAVCDDPLLPAAVGVQFQRLRFLVEHLIRTEEMQNLAGEHPLAQLLNEIGEMCLGWQPVDNGRDSLLDGITAIVDALCCGDAVSPQQLERLLGEWRAHARVERQQARLTQRRTEESEHARELHRAARATVDALMAQLPRLPSSATNLLQEGWRRVLSCAYLSGGSVGDEWRKAVGQMAEFVELWSRMSYALPDAMAQQLRDGMTRAGCDPLRTEILLAEINEAFGDWEPSVASERTQQQDHPVASATSMQVHSAEGQWYRFEGHGGSARLGKMARRVGEEGLLLVVDRGGHKLATFTQAQFAIQQQLKRAVAIQVRPLLERALERALKRSRNRAHHAA